MRRAIRYDAIVEKGVVGSRTALHRIRCDDPTFPDPIEVGGQIAWWEDEIDAWLEARPRRLNRAKLEAA